MAHGFQCVSTCTALPYAQQHPDAFSEHLLQRSDLTVRVVHHERRRRPPREFRLHRLLHLGQRQTDGRRQLIAREHPRDRHAVAKLVHHEQRE